MRRLIVGLASLAAMSGAAWSEERSTPAASAWLAEIDGGRYAQAWSDADPLMQGATTQAEFARGVGRARQPLGIELDRTLADTKAASSLPGAPDGRYLLLTYHSRFARKAQAVETLMMRMEVGGWKVGGYYIR